ncbi:hypothetical protein SacmaDRAFT_0371 [Saccharomonospora marina XMU15]|uniref:Uncharacterized protein n=1 Tax=Saccharomonospora marina XMU15 TaxID=882083 RepID=H5X282_9PSEU|nr:hypothetical protein [Saccharomonospora marina]EHR48678.1 hypothetical protein SacmaDRAFT_0371 [Saccharomonospora marina XMU15]
MASLNPLRLMRDGFASRLARLVDFRIDERTGKRLASQESRLTEQEHCTVDHRRRLDALEAGLDRLRGDLNWTSSEVKRLIPHVAAQEAQLEDLRVKIAMAPRADEQEVAAARSLIEEVQRQHAQIRVRLTGIAMYEDRLRRLEERASVAASG